MNFTELFIRKPVLSIVLSLALLAVGLQAAFNLSVRQYPESNSSVIVVNTVFVGASAELVQGFVTTPIERVITSVGGVDYIESKSAQDLSSIRAVLKLNYDPVRAIAEINAKINEISGELPAGSEKPALQIENLSGQLADAYITGTSPVLTSSQITDYLIRAVQPRLSSISGVKQAEVSGNKFAMRIWLKPNNMAAYGISPSDVLAALKRNNVQATVGQTKGTKTFMSLRADTDLRHIDEFEELIVRRTDAGTVRLKDIADIELGAEEKSHTFRYKGQDVVFLSITTQPTANSLEVISKLRAEINDIRKTLPQGMELDVAYDSTEYIEEAITEVTTTLVETLIIISLSIFLFLGFSRSVLIPLLAIPLSLIGAMFIIQLCGFSLNLLTLLAIVLSVGLVVDDAIIVVENIERHVTEGKAPFDAAVLAARELTSPIVSMTITIVSVYLPIAFQGGLTGTLFKEFAITLAGAIVISALVALILSPMLGSQLVQGEKKISGPLEPGFEKFRSFYRSFLQGILQHKKGSYILWLSVTCLIVPLYMFSPKELAPAEDQSFILGLTAGQSNYTLEQSAHYSEQIIEYVHEIPELKFDFMSISAQDGFAAWILKPWAERDRSVFELAPEVQRNLAEIAGLNVFVTLLPALPGGADFPVNFVIASPAPAEDIFQYAKKLQTAAHESGKFAFPPIMDMKFDSPTAEIAINREKVANYGLSLQDVTQDLAVLLGGNYVNYFNIEGRSYKVIPQVKRNTRLTPDDLQQLYISGPGDQLIRLAEVASIEVSTEPRSLNRFQQMNSVKLSGVSKVPLDEALAFLETESKKIMPSNYKFDYTGESRQLRIEGNKFLPTMGFAIFIVFLVLAAQFNSFRDPLIILLGSVPMALFGALIFTFIKSFVPHWTDPIASTLNIYSQVGLVTLVGLIVRNGILIVEFANKLQARGLSKLRAIIEASHIRLRPVLMTSIATIAGHTPLIFAAGAGAEARNSIGLVLVLGMLIGTVLSLIVLPSIYMLFARDLNNGLDESEDTESAPIQTYY